MMKWLISLSLSGLLMLNSGLKLAEVVDFFENRATIAATLCVEKDVPESCCAGSCHVAARTTALDGQASANAPQAPAPRAMAMAQASPMLTDRWDWRLALAQLLGLRPLWA